MHLTEPSLRITQTESGDYLMLIPQEWVLQNPLWRMLAPELVQSIKDGLGKPTTPTSAST